jgi:hypothetical protein
LNVQFGGHLTPIFWDLMVKSQIANLIFDLSFGYSLSFGFPNKECELIFNI